MINDEHVVEEQILNLLFTNPEGVSKDQISASIDISDADIVECLNNLIQNNRISIVEVNGESLFKYRSEKEAYKFRELTKEEMSVYEAIRQSGNTGITTNEIKMRLRMSSTTLLNKILKKLEKKLLIKSLKMVNMKNKKIWIGYEVEPSQEITGGIWYSNQEFNADLVTIFSEKCMDYIERQKVATRKEILFYAKSTGLVQGDIKEEDIQKIINILVFDGKIEAIFPDVVLSTTNKFSLLLKKNDNTLNSIRYRIAKEYQPKSIFNSIPCTFCPVFRECKVENTVNPQNCPWMQDFIKMI